MEARLDEPVATLKRRAQTALAVANGRLLDPSARLLDEEQTVKKAKLETGTTLTLQVGKVQVAGNSHAFLPSWVMDRLLPGAIKTLVATVVLGKVS